MEILINIAIGLFCVMLFGFICLFGWFWYQAYRLRNQAEGFIKDNAKRLAKGEFNGDISKFQQRLNEQMQKKNKK